MNILVIGGGGREHAIAWKLAQSRHNANIFVAPGNAGTALEKNIHNIPVSSDDIDALIQIAKSLRIDLTIVGPEIPLLKGVTDEFNLKGFKCLGPTKQAARLEGSKSFAKSFLDRHKIPTGNWRSFTDPKEASSWILSQPDQKLVIKADGLAAGKGVFIADSKESALIAVDNMLVKNHFGLSGQQIVVEEFLTGEEVSFICIVSNDQILPLATSQDHKSRYESDTGPNTGGMGAFSPCPLVDQNLNKKIMDQIILPTVNGLAEENTPYQGFLYAGLMIDKFGDPKVLEYNCRLGDPETQPILMRLQSDFIELCQAAINNDLNSFRIEWDPRPSIGIVMVSDGYPDDFKKGYKISGLDIQEEECVKIFHAGTKLLENNIITDGGRVICVTALDQNINLAREKAYDRVKTINWHGASWRTDIGNRRNFFNPK